MNWNNNDTKYILKRFIIYILISIAMFIIGTWNAKAITTDAFDFNSVIAANEDYKTINMNKFRSAGVGTIIFTIDYFNPGSQVAAADSLIREVTLYNSSNDAFECKIGNTMGYRDNNVYHNVISVECPINLPSDIFLYQLKVRRTSAYGTGDAMLFRTSEWATFIDSSSVQDMSSAINNVNNSVNNVNNSINNDSVSESDADNFSNNEAFSDSTGLESVIQLPLNMVNSLTSTCQPIQITIPFIDYTGEIPCMSSIYRSKFNTLYTIVKLVINGFFVYRLLLKVYELVHNAKQPDEDKLEVIDL